MTDTPTMTATEARLALEPTLKQFRPLLELERLLNTAVEFEQAEQTHAGEIARRKSELAKLDGQMRDAAQLIADAKAQAAKIIDDATAAGREKFAKASEEAAKVGAQAKARLDKAEADADAITNKSAAKVRAAEAAFASISAEIKKIEAAKDSALKNLDELTDQVLDEQAKLKAIRKGTMKPSAV